MNSRDTGPEYCVIDIGTNSARMMLCRMENGRAVCLGRKLVTTVRTGEGMVGKVITGQAMERVCRALADFKARTPEGVPVFAFATSAVRDAVNAEELVERILDTSGICTEILSGEDEARASFRGACGGAGGMIDIGGGSSEIAAGDENGMYRKSFETGIIRAGNMFAGEEERVKVKKTYELSKELFSSVPECIKRMDYTAVGGTATSAAAMLLEMKEYDPETITGCKVGINDIKEMLSRLLGMSVEERKTVCGLPPARADVICSGMAILLAAMDTLEIESYRASDRDNLEGFAELRLAQG